MYAAKYSTCAVCGSLHVINPTWLHHAYADPSAADRLDEGAPWRNTVLARATLAVGELAAPGRWLDYGCGQNLLVPKLRAAGRDVEGYDSYRRILVDEQSRYSLICAYEVLEHQVDPLSFMKDIRRRMTDDGILLLSTCLRQPHHGRDWNYLALPSGQHVSFASVHGLSDLAKRTGLSWWASGVCRENGDLQVHALTAGQPIPLVFDALGTTGFDVISRVGAG